MIIAGVDEPRLVPGHDPVERVEVIEAVDRRLVEGRDKGLAVAEVHGSEE